jgi:perosamine synthetase
MIPLSIPNISSKEWEYVKECLDTGWISSVGGFVNQFEEKLANYNNVKHCVAVSTGTAGLHVSLRLLGVVPNDYVLLPNITFVATANAVKYLGAEPIFFDIDSNNWQIDLDLLEEFLETQTTLLDDGNLINNKDGRTIKAVVPVHLQGNIMDMERFMELVSRFRLKVVEDAAEALGSKFNNKSAGTFGEFGVLSFNGNKIISTGGGGAILTNNDELAGKAKHLTTTAKTDSLEYHHDEVGYNYRLVNVLAAIGVAQMEVLDAYVIRKRQIADFYYESLDGVGDIRFQSIDDRVSCNQWLFTIQTQKKDELLNYLLSNDIQSRPFWMPMNTLPMYDSLKYVTTNDESKSVHKSCLSIPCSTGITNSQLEIVSSSIKQFFS